MIKITKLVLILIMILSARICLAEEYLTPETMSEDDWNVLNVAIQDYHVCLKQETVNWIDISDDARDVSNKILEVCSVILINLDREMESRNIHPDFRRHYIYTKKNRAGKNMLGGIMVMMANKQNETKQETSQ